MNEPNPPWANTILSDNFDAIVERVGIDKLPTPLSVEGRRKAKKFEELGDGHYGAVFPTATPGLVFKLTSDPSEANFVAAWLSMKLEDDMPMGIVQYEGVWKIPEARRRNRPVFVILREEAQDVGSLMTRATMKEGVKHREMEHKVRLVSERMMQFKKWASIARDRLKPSMDRNELKALEDWSEDAVSYGEVEEKEAKDIRVPSHISGIRAVAYAMRAAHIIADSMVQEDVGYMIGEVLGFCIDQGILLADVHLGNIGLVKRQEYKMPIWAITDPGHMVALDPKWDDVRIDDI
jgi:hypothetical protein